MNRIYVFNINNYMLKLLSITIPSIKKYAENTNAELVIVTKRKFPHLHPVAEKLQLYELSKNDSKSLLIDADVLVHPNVLNVFDYNDGHIRAYSEYNLNLAFKRFQPNVKGISSTVVFWNNTKRDLWNFNDQEVEKEENYKKDEYVINNQIKKNNWTYKSLYDLNPKQEGYFCHLDAYDDGRQKMSEEEISFIADKIWKSWN